MACGGDLAWDYTVGARLTNKSHACVRIIACVSEDSCDSPGACAYTGCPYEKLFEMSARCNLELRDRFYKFISEERRDRTLEVCAEVIEDAAFEHRRNAATVA